MKKIILQSLTLCNFKGEKERTTEFNPDITTIAGGNGLGKSRHFEAFLWLLFGKDSRERKDYNVRTVVNGEPLHKVECSVTGVFDIDGQTLTLKRSLVEEWVKSRKSGEQTYQGSHTECWWNETPVKVGEFGDRVNEIINVSVFKMLTNPTFFANMPWETQRKQLVLLAGSVTDAEIAKTNPDFITLLDRLSGKSLADFKREIADKKKRLKEKLAEIQPRIDQTTKLKPESEDFTALETQLVDIDGQIADIDKQIADHSAAIRAAYEEEQKKQSEINALKRKSQQALFGAQTKADKEAFEANAQRREMESDITSKERDLASMRRQLKSRESEETSLMKKMDELSDKAEKLRKEWFEINGMNYDDTDGAKELATAYKAAEEKQFEGQTVCPTCGQPLPQAMQDEAYRIFAESKEKELKRIADKMNAERVKFNEDKKKRLESITAKGKEIMSTLYPETKKQYEETMNEKSDIANSILLAEKEIEHTKEQLATIEEVKPTTIQACNVPQCAAISDEIKAIEATLSTEKGTDTLTEELQSKKNPLTEQRDGIKKHLAKREEIAKYDKEIADLEEKGKELSQQLSILEKEEYTARQFSKAKIEECESRINAMFTHVSFQLFKYTIDGKIYDNPDETCVPLVNGVPYGSANTAGKINAGLDIINVLCRYYGISAPIFIDNRESVNDIIPVESQIINLVVTNDNKLTIK